MPYYNLIPALEHVLPGDFTFVSDFDGTVTTAVYPSLIDIACMEFGLVPVHRHEEYRDFVTQYENEPDFYGRQKAYFTFIHDPLATELGVVHEAPMTEEALRGFGRLVGTRLYDRGDVKPGREGLIDQRYLDFIIDFLDGRFQLASDTPQRPRFMMMTGSPGAFVHGVMEAVLLRRVEELGLTAETYKERIAESFTTVGSNLYYPHEREDGLLYIDDSLELLGFEKRSAFLRMLVEKGAKLAGVAGDSLREKGSDWMIRSGVEGLSAEQQPLLPLMQWPPKMLVEEAAREHIVISLEEARKTGDGIGNLAEIVASSQRENLRASLLAKHGDRVAA